MSSKIGDLRRPSPVHSRAETAPPPAAQKPVEVAKQSFAPLPPATAAARLEAAKIEARIASMPNAGKMSALRANQGDAPKVAAALKAGLLDPEGKVTEKALAGLQVAAAYTEISARQKQALGAAGYPRQSIMDFPKVELKLNADETKLLLKKLEGQTPASVATAKLSEASGLIQTDPPNAIAGAIAGHALKAAGDGRLPGSQGKEIASGSQVKTFKEEFTREVLPAKKNLEEVINDVSRLNSDDSRVDALLDDPEFQKAIGTDAGKMAAHKEATKVGMTKCPMARGNHAKGVSLDKASMKVDPAAPPWLKEVLGNSLENGKVRISESHSDPLASGKVGHMPGIRFDFPVGNQSLSITANGGAETHESKSIREHTGFSVDISKPLPDGLRGKATIAGRVVKRLLERDAGDSLNPLNYAKEVKHNFGAVKNASQTSKQVLDEKFPETTFFARHTYNIGGRNVQLYLKPVDNGYADARGKASPTAYLQTITDHLRPGKEARPLEVEVYMIEMKPGDPPEMIEQENWQHAGVKIGRISVPPQEVAVEDATRSRQATAAESYFEKTPFIPGGNDKVAQGQGVLGRERVVGYAMSAAERTGRPITDFVQFDGPTPSELN